MGDRFYIVAQRVVFDYTWIVPIYTPDPALQQSAQFLVDNRYGGVVKRASTALDLDYIMFRRFLATGRSKPENRQKVRNALEMAEAGVTKDRKISHEVPIDMTRSMLMQLLEALDAYKSKTTPSASRTDL